MEYTGDIEYIYRLKDARQILERNVLHKERIVGFDCRYKTSLRGPVEKNTSNDLNDFENRIAVITLATASKVYIFHIGCYAENENKSDEKDNDGYKSDNDNNDNNNDNEEYDYNWVNNNVHNMYYNLQFNKSYSTANNCRSHRYNKNKRKTL